MSAAGTTPVVVEVLVAAITAGGLNQGLAWLAKRRGRDATTEVTLSKSAIDRMDRAEDKADRAATKVERLEAELQKIKWQLHAYELWADQHQIWDAEAVEENHLLGGKLRPPPQFVVIKGERT